MQQTSRPLSNTTQIFQNLTRMKPTSPRAAVDAKDLVIKIKIAIEKFREDEVDVSRFGEVFECLNLLAHELNIHRLSGEEYDSDFLKETLSKIQTELQK